LPIFGCAGAGIGFRSRPAIKGSRRSSSRSNTRISSNPATAFFNRKDIAFAEFTKTYLRDHVDVNTQPSTAAREREIVKTLNRFMGTALLHEVTAHRVEQFKRDRLAGKWRARGQVSPGKPVKPGTVNRELDTLRVIFAKAVEWRKLVDAPAIVKLRVDTVRREIPSEDEQARLIGACPKKLRCLVMLLLLTGARAGETLALPWTDVSDDGVLTFVHTKSGKIRCVGGTEHVQAVLQALPRTHRWVFVNARTGRPYTADGLRTMLRRALRRAGIVKAVSFHTLRHTLATRLTASNVDIKTVCAILGHSTPRMLLDRYAHESEARKQAALAANPGAVGHVLGTPGWAEQTVWTQTNEKLEEKLVDGARLELATSALRTRRSPN
jgi:integrase